MNQVRISDKYCKANYNGLFVFFNTNVVHDNFVGSHLFRYTLAEGIISVGNFRFS